MSIRDYANGNECIELTSVQVSLLASPGVYVMSNEQGKAIYVGSSPRMLHRATRKDHRHVGAYHSIIFIPCKDLAAARALEQELIADLRPALNVRGGMRMLASKLGCSPSHAYRLAHPKTD